MLYSVHRLIFSFFRSLLNVFMVLHHLSYLCSVFHNILPSCGVKIGRFKTKAVLDYVSNCLQLFLMYCNICWIKDKVNNPKVLTLQQGQTYPHIFNTTPIIFIFIFLQKLISFLIVFSDMSWGVVTKTAPLGVTFCNALTTERCSSEVPGGVSAMKNQSKTSKWT